MAKVKAKDDVKASEIKDKDDAITANVNVRADAEAKVKADAQSHIDAKVKAYDDARENSNGNNRMTTTVGLPVLLVAASFSIFLPRSPSW